MPPLLPPSPYHGRPRRYPVVETMLYDQVVSAVGKVVGGNEFADCMDHHLSRLFAPNYAPDPRVHGDGATFDYKVRGEG